MIVICYFQVSIATLDETSFKHIFLFLIKISVRFISIKKTSSKFYIDHYFKSSIKKSEEQLTTGWPVVIVKNLIYED